MKTTSHFVETTILGGVLFLKPIVVLTVMLRRGLQPVAKIIPDGLALAPAAHAILAILVLALACFLAGILARTLSAKRFVDELEGSVLSVTPDGAGDAAPLAKQRNGQ